MIPVAVIHRFLHNVGMTAPAYQPPPFGALSVTCPVCHSRPGRACVNKRGYLFDGGSHPSRRMLWLDEERQAARA